MPAKAKIRQIRIKLADDIDPDLSWIGKFTNRPESDFAIDLQASGLWERGNYRYFESGSVESSNTDAENRRYAAQDLMRMLSYGRDWEMVGICAEADIEVPLGKRTVRDTVSQCVYGVESDGGGAYLTETAKEELAELHAELEEMGFTRQEIADAPFNGSTNLFDYGDDDVPPMRPERVPELVYVGGEIEPEHIEEPREPRRSSALAGVKVQPYVKFRSRRP